jgi:hypothetical protein
MIIFIPCLVLKPFSKCNLGGMKQHFDLQVIAYGHIMFTEAKSIMLSFLSRVHEYVS